MQHAREITSQHDTRETQRHHEWPPFMMTIEELGQVLPHPSVVFHAITSTGIRGWSKHYPIVHPLCKVRYHPTRRSSKLLSLWDPIIMYASVHNQSCSSVPDDRCSIDTSGATTFRALNIKTYQSYPSHLVFSTFP
jgi:hypothetical protein